MRVQGDRVSGTLAPYADPETGKKLFTTFDGRIAGDTIAGTFTTRPGPAPHNAERPLERDAPAPVAAPPGAGAPDEKNAKPGPIGPGF